MRATEFEFRYRSLIITAIYLLGLSLYKLDHANVIGIWIRHTVGSGSLRATFLAHLAFGIGAFLVFLAASVRTWAAAYLRSNIVQDPGMHLETIVADGPYRHLRNPLYLGGILQAWGLGLLASVAGFVFISGGLTIFLFRLTGLEEAKLDREQGEGYREFCRQVPRLWPAWKPRLPKGPVTPRWGQAILGEIHMWGFFAGMAAFAVTLEAQLAGWILGSAVVLYAVRSYVLSKLRKDKDTISATDTRPAVK